MTAPVAVLQRHAGRAEPGMMVWPVLCIDRIGGEVLHIFSSLAAANEFAARDHRDHVLWEAVLDCPERLEGFAQ